MTIYRPVPIVGRPQTNFRVRVVTTHFVALHTLSPLLGATKCADSSTIGKLCHQTMGDKVCREYNLGNTIFGMLLPFSTVVRHVVALGNRC